MIIYCVDYGGSPLLFTKERDARQFFYDKARDPKRGFIYSTLIDSSVEEVNSYRKAGGNGPLHK